MAGKPEIKNQMRSDDRTTLRCTYCGNEKLLKSFSFSNSKYNNGNLNRLPICKDCLTEIYNEYMKKYNNDPYKAIYRVCELFNIYYSNSAVDASKNINYRHSRMTNYMSKINLKPSNGKTFDDTLDEMSTGKQELEALQESNDEESIEIIQKVTDIFGKTYELKYCKSLLKELEEWVAEIGDNTKPKKEICIKLAMNKVNSIIAQEQHNGKEMNELGKEFKELLDMADALPKQNKSDNTLEEKPLGVLVKEWEEHKPFKCDKKYVDIDDIRLTCHTYFKAGTVLGLGLKNTDIVTAYDRKELEKYTAHLAEIEDDASDDEDELEDIFED